MGARIGIQLCVSSASIYLIASNRTHDKVGKRRDQFLTCFCGPLLRMAVRVFFYLSFWHHFFLNLTFALGTLLNR